VQGTDPRRLVGERLEDLGVGEREDLILGAVSAETGTQAHPDGGVNLLELCIGGGGGIDTKLTLGFPFIDEALAEIHDHEVHRMDFDAPGFGVGEEPLGLLGEAVRIDG